MIFLLFEKIYFYLKNTKNLMKKINSQFFLRLKNVSYSIRMELCEFYHRYRLSRKGIRNKKSTHKLEILGNFILCLILKDYYIIFPENLSTGVPGFTFLKRIFFFLSYLLYLIFMVYGIYFLV